MPTIRLKSSKKIITAKKGLPILSFFLDKIGLAKTINSMFPLPGSNRGYLASDYIYSLIMSIHGGGKSLEDTRMLRNDPGFKELTPNINIPDPSSIGDWLRRFGTGYYENLNALNLSIFHKNSTDLKTNHLTLDIDATVIKANKYNAEFSFKGFKGYAPILGHIAENKAIVGYEFREGNEPGAKNNLSFIKQCVSNIPQGKKIKNLRADAATYQAEVINYCQANNIKFFIGGRLDANLRKHLTYSDLNWTPYVDSHGVKTDTEVCIAIWSMEKTDKAFLIIAKRKKSFYHPIFGETYYEYSVMATNDTSKTAQEAMQFYNFRGEASENRIKELKLGFAANRMPCGQFEANRAYFSLTVLAYNLFLMFKQQVLGVGFIKSSIQKVRLYIYNLPAIISKHSRYLYVNIPEHMYERIRIIYQRLILL